MATQFQANITGVLEQLGLEADPVDMPGAPVTMRVTQATVDKMQDLLNSSAFVTVDSDTATLAMA